MQVLLGPLRILVYAAQGFGLSEISRRAARRPKRLLWDCALVSIGLCGAAAAVTAGFVLMPERWGEAVLGDTWPLAKTLLLPVGGQLVATCALSGALLGLQVLGRAGVSFSASLLQAPFTLVLGIGGFYVGGAIGAATGFALAHCVSPLFCWVVLLTHRPAAVA